jgi:S1-C subfamily serine protease
MSTRGRPGISRETRLLTATIAVSLVVLLVLSRFRFPAVAGPDVDGSAAQPLARLAARAAFDDLSLAVRELTSRVEGSLLVVRTMTSPASAIDVFTSLTDVTDAPAGPGRTRRLVPALRMRDDIALVAAGPSTTIEGVVGVPGPPAVIGHDPVRGLALVRVPAVAAPVLNVREGMQPPVTPGYVAVAEATGAGAALRPVFIGRSDGTSDPRWDSPLFTMGRGAVGDIGAPVFMLDGRLAGLLTSSDGEPALIPAQVVVAAVDRLLRGETAARGDLGVTTQALDDALSAATGVVTGAAVVAVDGNGPAASALVPGDVVTAIDGQPVRSPAAFHLRVARSAPGTSLSLTVRRSRAFETVPVTVRVRPAAGRAAGDPTASGVAAARPLGLTMRVVDGRGIEVVRVQPDSAASTAGLQEGDVVIAAGRQRAPTADQITAAYAALTRGGAVFLSIERRGRPRLVSLTR